MLTQITIRNFAIVDALEVELDNGMTVISGETGAGKSIMLDALGLCLGNRADSDSLYKGADRAELTACFDIRELGSARLWLQEHELECDPRECLMRRVITREGRSRSYINGRPVPLTLMREFGQFLVDIHGQHEHQRLLKKDHHRVLLDAFGGQGELSDQVRRHFHKWRRLHSEFRALTEVSEERNARVQLLSYQVEELDQLALQPGELEALEQEQQRLENADGLLSSGHQLLQLSSEGDDTHCLSMLHHCLQLLGQLDAQDERLRQADEMLNSALIQVEEASREVRHFIDGIEINPERQQEVEERLSAIYDVARKHRLLPEELPAFHQSLQQELAGLTQSDEALVEMEAEVVHARDEYLGSAAELSLARQQAAETLGTRVDEQLHALGMPAAHFTACLTPLDEERYNANGLEEVEFLISTNEGQPARALAKVASGGELSRISLAIQVITAQSSSTPTLVFDEVDVGIGGGIAEVVGRMLHALGKRVQILCVTHQPQVAAQGDQHLFVSKNGKTTGKQTRVSRLSDKQRVEEVARMLGGVDITRTTLTHAQEMLSA
ncbi:DNA repair protein RecN [Marinobacterium stanieri]|uniref:DNA repair protein RecN n=1 Tax=Marinobacterium stanieri TaxID=49186 RepID=A0A1N6V2Y8_9GAMM|nr:DNA repair protein RecN [Marinobacterium stanieri]SIQ72253.1 DNA replication and repair protein RecN [Marinobacterium stanieri]